MTFNYPNPELEFFLYRNVNNEYSIELGKVMITETDLMTDDDLKQWAVDYDLGELTREEISIIKNRIDIENSNISSSPASRAFNFFRNEIGSEITPSLGIEFIEGFIPGNDTQVVIIQD